MKTDGPTPEIPPPSLHSLMANNTILIWLAFWVLLTIGVYSLFPGLSRTRSRRRGTGTPSRTIFSATEKAPETRPIELPVTDRTPEQIAAYGDFPDYASLSGVRQPVPYTGFDIAQALPRPYRPFRWEYKQTMTMRALEPDWWIELENTYATRIAQRQELYREHGKGVLDWLPGSEPACKELMEMVLLFLVNRYPMYFSLVRSKPSLAAPDVFVNGILGTESKLKEVNPLCVLLDHVPEDFAITLKNQETGLYEFRAGVICSALGWDVSTKIGKNLTQIHEIVPDYKENMQKHMDHYFSRLLPRNPIQRGSWGVERGQPLHLPPDHPGHELRAKQDPSLTVSDVFLRVDWQTLRRLPLSAGVVFNFKALFTPLVELRDEPFIPELLAKVLTDGKKNLMEYKGTWHIEHIALPALRDWAREQRQQGLVPADWEPQTLGKLSPFFPGWREKWIRKQGFEAVSA